MLKTSHLPKQECGNLNYNSPHAFEKGCGNALFALFDIRTWEENS